GVFSQFYAASFGSIYPALNQLVQEGLASVRAKAQDKRPDKKVYSITPSGRAAFVAALQAPPAADRIRSDFCFIMAFGHLLPAPLLERLIALRIAWYRARIAEMEACDASGDEVGARFVTGLGLAIYRVAADYLDDNKDMLLGAAPRKSKAARSRADQAEPRAEPRIADR
ncbi:MAG: PadR family transcriptional regulator, partial [Dongiaceae bacterium]